MVVKKEDIEKLRRVTKKDYALCEKALKKAKGDYLKAKEYVLLYNENDKGKIADNIASVLIGEKSVKFSICKDNEELFNIPVLVPIIVLLIIPVSAAFVGLCILLLVLLNCSINIRIDEGEKKEHFNIIKANKKVEETIIARETGNNEIKKEVPIIIEEGRFLTKEDDGTCQLIIK